MSSLRWPWRAASSSLSTRRLMPGDAAALALIHGASFAHGWDEDAMAAMVLDEMIQADGLIPAGSPGDRAALAGFVLSRCVLDEAEILTIAISDRWRGRGTSVQLLQHHLQCLAARGVRTVHLEVEEGNEPALRLYIRFGFNRTGERKGYYAKANGDRATAILMARELAVGGGD